MFERVKCLRAINKDEKMLMNLIKIAKLMEDDSSVESAIEAYEKLKIHKWGDCLEQKISHQVYFPANEIL